MKSLKENQTPRPVPPPAGTHGSQGTPASGQDKPISVCVYLRFGSYVESYIVENGRRYSPQEWERRLQRCAAQP